MHRALKVIGMLKTVLILAVVLLLLIVSPAFAQDAANNPLKISISNIDLSAFPRAAVALQVGGPATSQLGKIDRRAVEIFVDDVRMSSVEVSAAEASPLPNTVLLLIDESGSMKNAPIEAAKTAARQFIERMRPVDLVGIRAFNEGSRLLHELSGDKSALLASVDALRPRRETALYDALIEALKGLGAASGTGGRSVVLLSDGGDTRSRSSLDDAIALARASGIRVYTIGLKTKEFDSTPLSQMAAASGGRYLETTDPAELAGLFSELALEISNQYLVTVLLPEQNPAGQAGRMRVVVRTELGEADSTKGFFYPEEIPEPAKSEVHERPTSQAEESHAPAVLAGLAAFPRADIVVALAAFLLIFLCAYALLTLSRPSRTLLQDYGDVLANRRSLEPRSSQGDARKPGEHLIGRLLRLRGYESALQDRLEDAGWNLRTSEFALAHIGGLLLLMLVLRVLGASAGVLVVVAIVGAVAPLLLLEYRSRNIRSRFESQVPDSLLMLANALRAGQGFDQALQVVAAESPQPMGREFKRLVNQQRLGVEPEIALEAVAERMKSEAFDWVVMATLIQRQVGGNLAEIYETIAATLREREKLQREIKSLTAEGRYSAWILILLPFGLGFVLMVINSELMSLLFTTLIGRLMIILALLLLSVGALWIRRIVSFDY